MPDDIVERLPELPVQSGWGVDMHGELVAFANNAERARGMSPGATTPVFTADQMRAYAAEAVRAALAERAPESAQPVAWIDPWSIVWLCKNPQDRVLHTELRGVPVPKWAPLYTHPAPERVAPEPLGAPATSAAERGG